MKNPLKTIWQSVRSAGATVKTTVEKAVQAVAMVIGVPSSWFTYGYPPKVDWLRIEDVYRSFPMVSNAIEQLAEQAIGAGYVAKPVDDSDQAKKAVEIVQDFDKTHHAKAHMLRIARELLLYGNSPLERRFTKVRKDPDDAHVVLYLGEFVTIQALPISTMRIIPSMFTGADPPRGYVQIIMGQYNKLAPEQVAWFKVNMTSGNIGSDFYGMGLVQPILDYVWALQKMEDYMVRIMKRYAAPKVLWSLGSDKFPPAPGDEDTWAMKIKEVLPDEDYVAPFYVTASTIEPDLRARFEEYVAHFRQQIVAGLQNPNLILSMLTTRVSDASATGMQEGANRKVSIVQENIGSNWEELVYKPLVQQNGLDEKFTPEIVWGEPNVMKPEDSRDLIIKSLSPTVQITPRSRLDFENLLREQFELPPVDVEQELLAQAARQAVQQEHDNQMQKQGQDTEKKKIEMLTALRESLSGDSTKNSKKSR